jgi:uncharacterized protein
MQHQRTDCATLHGMSTNTTAEKDGFLKSLHEALMELYGPALDRVVLLGSHARGDAAPDSDYDVAVFPKNMDNRRIEWYRLADLRLRLLDEGRPFFEATPFRASDTTSVPL